MTAMVLPLSIGLMFAAVMSTGLMAIVWRAVFTERNTPITRVYALATHSKEIIRAWRGGPR